VRVVAEDAVARRTRLYPVLLVIAVLAAVLMGRRETTTPGIWTVHVGETPLALATAERSSRVFVANSNGQSVSMLDARTGTMLATLPLGGVPIAIALDETRGRVFTLNACAPMSQAHPEQRCLGLPSSVSVLDLRGILRGTVAVGNGAIALAVDEHAGRVLVANAADGTLAVLNADGRVLRTVDVGGSPVALAVDARTGHAFLTSVDRFGRGSRVSMVDSRTGTILRTIVVGHVVSNIVCDARAGRVLVSGENGLRLLDTRTGQILRHIAAGVPLTIDEGTGRALIAHQGQMWLLAMRDGAFVRPVDDHGILRTLAIDRVAVDETAGRFYVAAHSVVKQHGTPTTIGQIVVLDARSGRVLHTLSLAVPVSNVAMDTAAHRLFLVNSGTVARSPGRDGGPQLVAWMRRVLPWVPFPAHSPAATGTVTVVDTTRL
jgi:DNA-binding beta-propeller fold protein YncE